MKTRPKFFIPPPCHPFSAIRMVAATLLLGVLAGSAQTNQYLFTGSMTNITLNPGTYDITAYGAQGGSFNVLVTGGGGPGAEMKARFSFATAVNLTLLVGGAGGGGYRDYVSGSGGGGGGSFVVNGATPLVIASGGGGGGAGPNGDSGYGGGYGNVGSGGSGGSGGACPSGDYYAGGGGGGYSGDGTGGGNSTGNGGYSFSDGGGGGSSFAAGNGGFGGGGGGGWNFTYSNGSYISQPSGGGGGGGYSGGNGGSSGNGGGGGGSIIDSSAMAIITEISGVASPDDSPNGEIIIAAVPKPITLALAATAGGQFGFNITGPTNATIVVEACTNLANPVWVPLATNTLGNGTNYFSDAQWTNRPYRFYRASGQ